MMQHLHIFPEIKFLIAFLKINMNSWPPPSGPHPSESARRTRLQRCFRWHRLQRRRVGTGRPRIRGVEPGADYQCFLPKIWLNLAIVDLPSGNYNYGKIHHAIGTLTISTGPWPQ